MIDTQKLHQALREMGSEGLKQPYKDQWLRERPTTGRCYIVAEIVMKYYAPEGSETYRFADEDGESHWFVKTPDGTIIDPTADQFDECPPYHKAKKHHLIPVKGGGMSKDAKTLAGKLGLEKKTRGE